MSTLETFKNLPDHENYYTIVVDFILLSTLLFMEQLDTSKGKSDGIKLIVDEFNMKDAEKQELVRIIHEELEILRKRREGESFLKPIEDVVLGKVGNLESLIDHIKVGRIWAVLFMSKDQREARIKIGELFKHTDVRVRQALASNSLVAKYFPKETKNLFYDPHLKVRERISKNASASKLLSKGEREKFEQSYLHTQS